MDGAEKSCLQSIGEPILIHQDPNGVTIASQDRHLHGSAETIKIRIRCKRKTRSDSI